jgi:pyruvate kinase
MRKTQPGLKSERGSVVSLVRQLERVRTRLLELESAVDLRSFGTEQDSARNLLHYLAFRRSDLRRAQDRLAHWGLSSLGRSESHVLYNLEVVLWWLDILRAGKTRDPPSSDGLDPERGRQILALHARALFGPTRPGRGVRIMVTMPSEAASDYSLVRDLVEGGMDCARINCAHESPAEWARMIGHIQRAEKATGRRCRIEMDLAGPKLRTGPVRPGPSVLKLRPKRDVFGRVTHPASVWITSLANLPLIPPGASAITVAEDWLLRRRLREPLRLIDARGARRTLRVVNRSDGRLRAESRKTTYLTPETQLVGIRAAGREDSTTAGSIPPLEQRIRMRVGETIVITSEPLPGEPVQRDRAGHEVEPAHIATTLPEGLQYVRRGDTIWFDDGRIGGVVRSASSDRLVVKVLHAPPEGAWLAGDKGINLPQTHLDLPAIPPKDREDLRFIVRHADLVGLSFVHSASDLEQLRAELRRLGRPRMGVVLKIETKRAFDELPAILLGALHQPPVSVMIARGDLAVEVGFERLAEAQEEILWLCEAAHIPAIWATQVLEGLTKTGLPSRAEVTDAAMGERAECVMLNKGPHVVEAVRALDSILHRMQAHQSKKMAMLRPLHIVERFQRDGGEPGRRSSRRRTIGVQDRRL